ncbi:MAG: LytTR family DNA-binding domain-containing protein [Atopobiaceae bacterium]|nr:LytTR family DNA-binding domain-containing protein [Atopobiaceae bacterium]
MDLHIDIVDDLASDRERLAKDLRGYFDQRPINLDLREYESAEQALVAFEAGKTQVMFLDICMDGMSGIQLAERIRQADQRVLIIFLTTSPEYAFDAFPVHPFDYLMKPYEVERLHAVLSEAMRALEMEEQTIAIRVPRDTHEVPLSKLCAIESRGHSVEVHLTDGQTLRSIMTFAEIEKLLADDARFLRCNRGVIVNMDQVLRLDRDMFKMRDGTIFPLRVRNRAALISQFSQYTISKMERA